MKSTILENFTSNNYSVSNSTLTNINDTEYDEQTIRKLRIALTSFGLIIVIIVAISTMYFSLTFSEIYQNKAILLILSIGIISFLAVPVYKLAFCSTADFNYYLIVYESLFGIFGALCLIVIASYLLLRSNKFIKKNKVTIDGLKP